MADKTINQLIELQNPLETDTIPIWSGANGNTMKIPLSKISASGNGDFLYFEQSRWLVFDFSDANHKSLKIKANTKIPLDIVNSGSTERRWFNVDVDTKYNLSSMITAAANASSVRTGEANGRDFYLYLAPDVTDNVKIVLSCNSLVPSDISSSYTSNNTKKIGQFHTLCVNAGSLVATVPAAHDTVTVGNNYLLKNYQSDDKDGFYNFYNKSVSAIASNAIYDTLTTVHPLSGFAAGDILPESIWCLTFRPKCSPDGMCYDPDTDIAVDIYLQSGKGRNTASVYGGTTTRTREQQNHQADMNAVGKLLISDDEFTSAALGSNEKTSIYGVAEASITTTGGHTDTASRRMISFLGIEDMCGGVWQWLRNVSANNGINWSNDDGVGNFGQTYGTSNALIAGGSWGDGASCGSRCRASNSWRGGAGANLGGRGVSRVIRGF